MARALLLTVLALLASDDWLALKGEFDDAFKPLPVKRMFGDPMKELNLSRRAPFTDGVNAEIDRNRQKARLRREQIRAERRKREELLRRIGASGGPHAAGTLLRAYELQLENMALAQKNLDRFLLAAKVDTNPGTDPGGHTWKVWLKDYEIKAASGVLEDERKVRDIALEEAVKLLTPEVREWIAGTARSHESPEVREQMVTTLAKLGDAESVAAIAATFGEERETWARVMILEVVGAAKTPGAAPFVLDALRDDAWPVRSAAIAAVGLLELRDAAAVEALVASMEREDGRLRHEARHALAVATGQSFGMMPEEWRLWWSANRAGWTPPSKPAKVEPFTEGLPRFCGVATASKRIAFVVPSDSSMLTATKRRAKSNDGSPSPEPAVDTLARIAAWEFEETLSALPEDALFTLIVAKERAAVWARKLKKPTRDARRGALAYLRKWKPEGSSDVPLAIEAALGFEDVDTIFVVTGRKARRRYENLEVGGRKLGEILRLRRVRVVPVYPGAD